MSGALSFRHGTALTAFDRLDAQLRAWALGQGCDEYQFTAMIDAETLRLADYPAAFPHLLLSATKAADPLEPQSTAILSDTAWFLSPAVCYHVYAALAGQTIDSGKVLTARGPCFRNEDPGQLASGRRQIEFQMREIVLVGDPDWIEVRLSELQPDVDRLAAAFELTAAWFPATDPFFLPLARGKMQMQRLLGTKIELCLADGLAIASINRHGAFFGERFKILSENGRPAHSACVAFGLDRWAHAIPTAA